MNGNHRPLEVLVYGRSGFIGSFVFTDSKISIGRDPGSMVHLDDPLVSRNHAVLAMDGGLFRIKDLGSRTGTKVNGAPVRPRQPVEPADEVSIGPFRLKITTCEPDDDEAGPPSDEPTQTRSVPPANLKPSPSSDDATVTRPVPAATLKESIPLTGPTARPFFAAASDDTVASLLANLREVTSPKPAEPVVAASPVHGHGGRGAPEMSIATPTAVPMQAASLGASLPTQVGMASLPISRPPAPVARAAAPAPVAKAEVRREDAPREVPSIPVAAPAAVPEAWDGGDEDDEDDEDDDRDFVPPFDLVAALLGDAKDESAIRGHQLSLEVIHYRDDRIISLHYPRARESVRPVGATEPVGAVEADGCFVFYPETVRAFTVQERGRVMTTGEALAMRDGASLRLATGMQVTMDVGGEDKVLIRWVPRTVKLQSPRIFQRPANDRMTTGFLSIVVHLAILVFVGLVVIDEKKGEADINAGRFATISTKELELEPPPPPPPEAPTADVPPTVEELPSTPVRTVSKSKTAVAVRGPTERTAAPTAASKKILSALGGTSSALSAISVTNLDALSSTAGDFKVSGSVGKAPGDTLRVAAPGSGSTDIDTKSASELGSKMTKVQAQTGGAVRARVTASVQAVRGEGHLDRSEIQKVVNAHLYQVQGCYERQLARDPSLSGKISYEWVVDGSGGVSNVRIGRSSVHSVEVTSCIQSAIAGWKFPSPVGGSVTVTYPFAFSSLGG